MERLYNNSKIMEFLIELSKNKPIKLVLIKKNRSKNQPRLVLVNGEPKYVIKISKHTEKEISALQIMDKNRLGNVPKIVGFGEDFHVTIYEPDLIISESEEEFIEEIANFHVNGINADINLSQDYFRNIGRERAITRVSKHPEIVKNYYPNVDKLVRFMERKAEIYQSLPNILVHGDLHKRNICKVRNGFIYLDFELSFFEKPSWDLARIVLDLEPHRFKLIRRYAEIVSNKTGISYEELIECSFIDFVFKFTSVGIGVQQDKSFKEYAQRYLVPIRRNLELIISGEAFKYIL